MAWYRALPNTRNSPIKATGVKGLYCDNAAKPEKHTGIGTPSRLKKKAKWAMQRHRNIAARREVNNMLRGKPFGVGVAEFHSRLAAISVGNA